MTNFILSRRYFDAILIACLLIYCCVIPAVCTSAECVFHKLPVNMQNGGVDIRSNLYHLFIKMSYVKNVNIFNRASQYDLKLICKQSHQKINRNFNCLYGNLTLGTEVNRYTPVFFIIQIRGDPLLIYFRIRSVRHMTCLSMTKISQFNGKRMSSFSTGIFHSNNRPLIYFIYSNKCSLRSPQAFLCNLGRSFSYICSRYSSGKYTTQNKYFKSVKNRLSTKPVILLSEEIILEPGSCKDTFRSIGHAPLLAKIVLLIICGIITSILIWYGVWRIIIGRTIIIKIGGIGILLLSLIFIWGPAWIAREVSICNSIEHETQYYKNYDSHNQLF